MENVRLEVCQRREHSISNDESTVGTPLLTTGLDRVSDDRRDVTCDSISCGPGVELIDCRDNPSVIEGRKSVRQPFGDQRFVEAD